MSKGIRKTDTTTLVDVSTGEVLSQTKKDTSYGADAEPDFVKLYLDDISRLYELPKSSTVILYELLKHMTYSQQLVLTASIKRQIAEKLETSVQHIKNQISKYVKADIIQRIDHALYMFNPALIAKGRWIDIKEHRAQYIDLKIRYRSDGTKQMKACVGFEDQAQINFPK
jgi:hypothetical protein